MILKSMCLVLKKQNLMIWYVNHSQYIFRVLGGVLLSIIHVRILYLIQVIIIVPEKVTSIQYTGDGNVKETNEYVWARTQHAQTLGVFQWKDLNGSIQKRIYANSKNAI